MVVGSTNILQVRDELGWLLVHRLAKCWRSEGTFKPKFRNIRSPNKNAPESIRNKKIGLRTFRNFGFIRKVDLHHDFSQNHVVISINPLAQGMIIIHPLEKVLTLWIHFHGVLFARTDYLPLFLLNRIPLISLQVAGCRFPMSPPVPSAQTPGASSSSSSSTSSPWPLPGRLAPILTSYY